jgi:hypothetical protein
MPDIQIEKIQPEQTKVVLEFSQNGIAKLTEAIAKARPKFGVIKKSAENPFYKDAHGKPRKYADLAEIITATAEPLAEEGLYVFQAPFIEPGKTVGIITLLSHNSGEWLKTTISGCPADQKIKDKNGDLTISRFEAQTIGIGFTYLARYGLRAILSVGSDEDDDGNGLVSQHPEPKKPLQIAKASSLSEPAGIPRTAMGVITVSPEAIKVEGTTVATATADEDGCPLSDSEVPKDLQLPTQEQLRGFGTTLKALGQDSRLLKNWFEKEAGSEWKKIPYVKFQPIIDKLKLAEKEGKLTGLITNF